MSTLMDAEMKRWTARRKSALVLAIIYGKTTVAEVVRVNVVAACIMRLKPIFSPLVPR